MNIISKYKTCICRALYKRAFINCHMEGVAQFRVCVHVGSCFFQIPGMGFHYIKSVLEGRFVIFILNLRRIVISLLQICKEGWIMYTLLHEILPNPPPPSANKWEPPKDTSKDNNWPKLALVWPKMSLLSKICYAWSKFILVDNQSYVQLQSVPYFVPCICIPVNQPVVK